MDILIFKLSALGDVLRTTSLLRPLLARYPKAKLTWVTSQAALPLLENNPYLAEFLAWGPETKKLLSGRKIDLVLSLEEDEGIARLITQSLTARDVVGVVWTGRGLAYSPSSAPYYDMSLLNRDPDGGLTNANRLKKANQKTYLELWATILGLPALDQEALRPVLRLQDSDRAAAKTVLGSLPELKRPLIGFNPSAGNRWPAKRLTALRAGALSRGLMNRFGAPVLLLGGPDEADYAATALREAGPAALEAGTGHSLREFAAILEACDAVLTADSLAFHLANAVGTPAAVFVGPTSVAELDVFGPGVRLAPAQECQDFYKAKCTLEQSCIDRIPDDRYAAAVERLLR